MRLAAAVICDSATVREGLLHVLGAGVTRMWRQSYPAPLDVAVALLVEMTGQELGKPHELEVSVTGPGGPVANATGGFQAERSADLAAGETQLLPVVIDLRPGALPAGGRYRVGVRIDGTEHAVLSFTARLAAERGMARAPAPTGQRPH